MTDLIDTIITELGSLRGFQEFSATSNPSIVTGAYRVKLTLNGSTFNSGNDISVSLTTGDSLATIATAIAAAINAITASSVTAEVDATSGKIRVKSVNSTPLTSQVSFTAPTSGNSLITLLTSVGPSIKMPQLQASPVVNGTKTLPIISIMATIEQVPFYCLDNRARIKESSFSVRIYPNFDSTATRTKEIADLLQSECERIINTKSLSGGWWAVQSTFFEKGDHVEIPHILAKQTLFVTTLGRA